ncbi:hypothetical protein QWJ90_01275 [Microbacterium oryzae]|uniref:hypothetical protein n=1 Tax=Microbacterium oryzae TaxID=743009 RepID=UPI0025AF6BB0|nr:hypothetical protein [Microbacterium oryzae]MDN3309553.1 hypothetical protein [Microbacterium oryzae]
MKRATLATTITAAAVIVGGGTASAFALAQDQRTPDTTVQSATAEPTPEVTPTGTPEAVETPAPSAEPTPQATYSEGEAFLIEVTQRDLPELALTGQEILDAAFEVCATPNAGPVVPTDRFTSASEDQIIQFRVNAEYHVCD